jgi:hypothetical protein
MRALIVGRRSWPARIVASVCLAIALLGSGHAWAAGDPAAALMALSGPRAESHASAFKICNDQKYALCATAKCFVFDDISYCRCDIQFGDSISLAFNYAPGRDVCTANAQGARNGFMLSTFSLPRAVVAPSGRKALYDCPATSTGAYAQCDGGFCFKSTRSQRFPGFAKPLAANEIVCSCPITVPDPATAKIGFQIAGPYPCERSFFKNCRSPPASASTGATIFVGAPTGTATVLAKLLNGSVPQVNRCRPPRDFTG